MAEGGSKFKPPKGEKEVVEVQKLYTANKFVELIQRRTDPINSDVNRKEFSHQLNVLLTDGLKNPQKMKASEILKYYNGSFSTIGSLVKTTPEEKIEPMMEKVRYVVDVAVQETKDRDYIRTRFERELADPSVVSIMPESFRKKFAEAIEGLKEPRFEHPIEASLPRENLASSFVENRAVSANQATQLIQAAQSTIIEPATMTYDDARRQWGRIGSVGFSSSAMAAATDTLEKANERMTQIRDVILFPSKGLKLEVSLAPEDLVKIREIASNNASNIMSTFGASITGMKGEEAANQRLNELATLSTDVIKDMLNFGRPGSGYKFPTFKPFEKIGKSQEEVVERRETMLQKGAGSRMVDKIKKAPPNNALDATKRDLENEIKGLNKLDKQNLVNRLIAIETAYQVLGRADAAREYALSHSKRDVRETLAEFVQKPDTTQIYSSDLVSLSVSRGRGSNKIKLVDYSEVEGTEQAKAAIKLIQEKVRIDLGNALGEISGADDRARQLDASLLNVKIHAQIDYYYHLFENVDQKNGLLNLKDEANGMIVRRAQELHVGVYEQGINLNLIKNTDIGAHFEMVTKERGSWSDTTSPRAAQIEAGLDNRFTIEDLMDKGNKDREKVWVDLVTLNAGKVIPDTVNDFKQPLGIGGAGGS